MPTDQTDNDEADFWDEVRRLIDQHPEGIAFVVFKMKYGIDLHIDQLRTISLGEKTLTIFHPEGTRTLIDARNIYSAYVSLKD